MAAPSMVSRDGESTLVRSVDAVFGASDDEENEWDQDEEGGGSGQEEGDPADLPQCKIKRNYACASCDYFTQNPRFYLYHQKQVHKEKIKIFECPHCLYASKHSQKLQRHIHMVHVMGKKKVKVKMMKKAAKLKLKLPPPRPAPPPPSQSPPPPAEEQPEVPTEEDFLPDEDGLVDYAPEPIFGVDGTRVYKCSVCDMLSTSQALITKHERVVHLKRKFFRCNKCNFITHIKSRYTKHMKYHTMPMIKCEMCDFKTPYKWNLDRHNKNHQGDGAFKCVMCNFAADIKQSLTVHEMNHHIPPVGMIPGNRRQPKVGASDSMGMLREEDGIDDEELNLLRMEREGSIEHMEQNPADFLQTQLEEPPSPTFPQQQSPLSMKLSMSPVMGPAGKSNYDKSPTPGFIQIQKYKCKYCDYSGNLGEVQRHEVGAHEEAEQYEEGKVYEDSQQYDAHGELQRQEETGRRVPKPIPNLIPIQGQSVLKPPCERKIEPDPHESFKRKNASFFDKLKEKLMTSGGERDLTCGICGFESKCLSEHLKHHKSHSEEESGTGFQGELSSTRCQHCRQRCKTSSDLVLHLQTCSAVPNTSDNLEVKSEHDETEEKHSKDRECGDAGRPSHPMENKVFVWNNFSQESEQKQMVPFEMNFYQPRPEDREPPPPPPPPPPPASDNIASSNHTSFESFPPAYQPKETTRKVFKCPNCSFWASTASRFHVHIVGHLNKRPFQCSLCHYSSNWRWDITKHIRLKQLRDDAHEKARVLLTDEAGRRNYSKYNKYLVSISLDEFKKAQVPRRGGIPKENSDPSEKRVVCNYGKRPLEENEEEDRPKKKPFSENRKTMWKCKKCLFRNSDRAVVLAHVKDHYRSLAEGKPVTPVPPETKNNQQEQEEKSGEGGEGEEESWERREEEEAAKLFRRDPNQSFEHMCETCPFGCDTLEVLQEHAERHFVSQGGANAKCDFCPYYADNAEQLLEHLELHLDQDPDDDDPRRNVIFACLDCPYVGFTRQQLIYHRKWHNKDYPHKCFKCDYSTHSNITLSLHVRLHGRNHTEEKKASPEKKSPPEADISGIDTSSFPEIPMVWVSKPMGISKLFKCRFCPHINMRKTNIQDHEKMHNLRDTRKDLTHLCPNCDYSCNSSGILSTHLKVHQAVQGQICGIVDHKMSDEEQIKNMKQRVAEYEASFKSKEEDEEEDNEDTHYEERISKVLTFKDIDAKKGLILHFCPICPARFLFLKEIIIHSRFHKLKLPFKCPSCCYSTRQRAHMMAHLKVHSDGYKERTTSLTSSYPTHESFPMPKIVVVLGKPDESSWNWKNESVWVAVKEGANGLIDDSKENENSEPKKPFTCNKCPAEFFKEVALSYHMSLHGGPGPHKCKYCDYGVKTYGNLLRHEAIHAKNDRHEAIHAKNDTPNKLNLKTGEGTAVEHFKQKNELIKGSTQKTASPPQEDPEFGSLIFGNPDFVYPTYIKNGRMREKRYKCHKCPSAFEKREQYKIHLSLHGSRQRYSCDKCDYSVKYFANFSQHMKKHSYTDNNKKQNGEAIIEDKDDEIPEPPENERCAKSLKMSVIDNQATTIMQAKNTPGGKRLNLSESLGRCPHCPYARKEGVNQAHLRCHSAKKGLYACKYCDYSIVQPHIMRDHVKVHFSSIRFLKPEAYLQCNKLEIWSEPVDSNHNKKKTLIFKDKGLGNVKNRFLPKIENQEFDNIKGRIYINLRTGEEEVETDEDRGVEERSEGSEGGEEGRGGEEESEGELGGGGGESSSDSQLSAQHSD